MWRAVAKAHDKAGNREAAAQARATAKLWGQGAPKNYKISTVTRE